MFKLKELRGKKTKTGKTGTLEQAAQGNAGVTAPEVLKKSTDVVLRDMAQWAMLMVGRVGGQDDLRGHFQYQ